MQRAAAEMPLPRAWLEHRLTPDFGWAVGLLRRLAAVSLLCLGGFPYVLRNTSSGGWRKASTNRSSRWWKHVYHHYRPWRKHSARQRGPDTDLGGEAGTIQPLLFLCVIHFVSGLPVCDVWNGLQLGSQLKGIKYLTILSYIFLFQDSKAFFLLPPPQTNTRRYLHPSIRQAPNP